MIEEGTIRVYVRTGRCWCLFFFSGKGENQTVNWKFFRPLLFLLLPSLSTSSPSFLLLLLPSLPGKELALCYCACVAHMAEAQHVTWDQTLSFFFSDKDVNWQLDQMKCLIGWNGPDWNNVQFEHVTWDLKCAFSATIKHVFLSTKHTFLFERGKALRVRHKESFERRASTLADCRTTNMD